jgi:hypothetical protein
VVVAYIASEGVAIRVVKKNTIQGFLQIARRSVASKDHVWLYSVRLPLHILQRSLSSGIVLAASTAASSILSTSSASLILLHWRDIHHGLLEGEYIHYLCYAVGALQLFL